MHLAIGAFLIIMSRQGTATAEGACLGVGLFYISAFVIGVVGESNLTIISMFGRDDLKNLNHLVNGVLLLGYRTRVFGCHRGGRRSAPGLFRLAHLQRPRCPPRRARRA